MMAAVEPALAPVADRLERPPTRALRV